MVSGQFFWWIGVGVFVVAELLTGTFYLLMIALGFLAGGLAHLAGVPAAWQLAAAALVALVAVIALRRSGLGRKQKRDAGANPDVNLDIGATIEITHWRDRRARAQYRARRGTSNSRPASARTRICTKCARCGAIV